MDVDPAQNTSQGTRDAGTPAESAKQQKTSQSQSQPQAKVRVRSRKKDVHGGGNDDSKRRCVSTACIGTVP